MVLSRGAFDTATRPSWRVRPFPDALAAATLPPSSTDRSCSPAPTTWTTGAGRAGPPRVSRVVLAGGDVALSEQVADDVREADMLPTASPADRTPPPRRSRARSPTTAGGWTARSSRWATGPTDATPSPTPLPRRSWPRNPQPVLLVTPSTLPAATSDVLTTCSSTTLLADHRGGPVAVSRTSSRSSRRPVTRSSGLGADRYETATRLAARALQAVPTAAVCGSCPARPSRTPWPPARRLDPRRADRPDRPAGPVGKDRACCRRTLTPSRGRRHRGPDAIASRRRPGPSRDR